MTTKPVVNFAVDPALLRQLDAFHHRHRFPTRSVAVKWLLMWALKQNPKPTAEEVAATVWSRGRTKGAKS